MQPGETAFNPETAAAVWAKRPQQGPKPCWQLLKLPRKVVLN